ncbi:unnamed protein product [Mytilus edulis]|uniref:Uncharacterized protein n=1 Tax=Mytilus edulis TaxID=6550 RepID=A0A8S3UHX4_MYTED|nr:unnamed protein product [Mytilus edulis]
MAYYEFNGRPLLYHSSAVLSVDSNTEFRMIVEDTQVIVYLTHMSSKSCISPDIAASIQECLTAVLEVVLKFYLSTIGKSHQMANLSNLFQIEVGEVCGRSPCMVSITKAKLQSDWVCDSGNEHSSRYPLLWVFNKTQEECPPTCPDIADVRLQEVPHDDVLYGLPKYLGYCAIQLGIELGVTMSSINETMVRHHKDMYDQISDILRKWKSSGKLNLQYTG